MQSEKRKAHLIGIGGAGMSALAQLLAGSGVEVSGSDSRESEAIATLRNANIRVSVGHDSSLIDGVTEIIFSPAIPQCNPELLSARKRGCRIQSRAEALAEFVNSRKPICITGSHGKTTTTAMLAFILEQNGLDPGYMLGGICDSLDRRNARLGTGPFVTEACEAFGALNEWNPAHCVITNIDDEHAEHYGGTAGLRRAFEDMIGRVPLDGMIAVCGDDNGLNAVYRGTGRRLISYGLAPANDVRAIVHTLDDTRAAFTVYRNERPTGIIELQIPGQHNVCNALAALIIAEGLHIPFHKIASALHDFQGVHRRCQLVGQVGDISIFDDYAHHPAEIQATLDVALCAVQREGKLVVAFEPQLHSRVRRLASSFAAALSVANMVVLMPVDAAGESQASGSDDLLAHALAASRTQFCLAATPQQVVRIAVDNLKSGDVFVAVGPGLIASVGKDLLGELESRQHEPKLVGLPSLSQSIGTSTCPMSSSSILHRFLRNVRVAPEAPAVVCGTEHISYKQLSDRAKSFASRLFEVGIQTNQVVAVKMGRSIDRTVAFVATMMAGAVYLPVDPSTPTERTAFLLEDSEARVLVSDLPVHPTLTNLSIISNFSPLSRDAGPTEIRCPEAHDIAYIIYTSGTTGTPKGVLIEHAALVNVAAASINIFGITRASRVSQVSAFGFDVAVGDLAMALYAGACLVGPDDSSAQPGSPLAKFIRYSAVTHLSLTPSALSAIPFGEYPALTHIIVCGERCPPDLAERWMPNYRFFYGPAEATVWCTVDECLPKRPISIGTPIANTQVYILGDDRKPVPRGSTGEIWIAGAGLARSYLKRPDLTSERFASIAVEDQCVRAYRTGDLAQMSMDGRIYLLGREDSQVKLRGFRIELEEVEVALRRHPTILDAIVDIRKDLTGSDRLVAYLIPTGTIHSQTDIASFLGMWLPSYMIPSSIVQIQQLPFNHNGKLDRAALSDPFEYSTQGSKRRRRPPSTPIEASILNIFRREFQLDSEFGTADTIAELGIDSLQTANLFLSIEKHFGIDLPSEAYSNTATINALANYVEAGAKNLPVLYTPADSLPDFTAITRKQLGHLSAWTGTRIGGSSFIRSHNAKGSRSPLFWCFQGSWEHESLAAALGAHQPLHGMRSGHLVFRYTYENIRVLANHYADEMIMLQPEGRIRVGGNCQGGIIAREIALELCARHRIVDLLFLLDLDRFSIYDGRVALIFSTDSPRNPYRLGSEPDDLFKAAYGTGYSVAFLPGDSDSAFRSPCVDVLAAILTKHLSEPNSNLPDGWR